MRGLQWRRLLSSSEGGAAVSWRRPLRAGNPLVALVGTPNVGKSTLFNRLAGMNKAIVTKAAGTTRDRIYGSYEWAGRHYDLVDTGGLFGSKKEDMFSRTVEEQARVAAEEADCIVVMVDGQRGVQAGDRKVAQLLRRTMAHKQAVLVVNKVDSDEQVERLREQHAYRSLGLGVPLLVSAIHNEGVLDLMNELEKMLHPDVAQNYSTRKEQRKRLRELAKQKSKARKMLKQQQQQEELQQKGLGMEQQEGGDALQLGNQQSDAADAAAGAARPINVALVGVPNVGKSSLVNRLSGSQRSIVTEFPGTTFDPLDTSLMWRGNTPLTLVDTAGYSRQKLRGIERASVLWAMKAIQRSDVSILVVDATRGVTSHEQRIAGAIVERSASCVVAINKSDMLIDTSDKTRLKYEKSVRYQLRFMPWVPIVFVSAEEGVNVSKMMDKAVEVWQQRRTTRIPTRRLNQIIRKAMERRPPPTKGHLKLKIPFVTQARVSLPTFVFFVNYPELVHFSYQRFLENSIRQAYPFEGTPISLRFRKKGGKGKMLSHSKT